MPNRSKDAQFPSVALVFAFLGSTTTAKIRDQNKLLDHRDPWV